MNRRIIIEGKRVHNVGYRPFLLAKAMRFGIQRFEAENVIEKGKQKVIVSIAGEEKQIQEFVKFLKENYPIQARVLRIVEDSEVPDTVMDISDYNRILAAEQRNTIVQTGLGMLEKQDKMLEKQDQTISEVKKVGEKVDQGFSRMDQNFTTLRDDYGRISDKMDSIDKTLQKLTKAILKLAEKSAR